MYSPPFLAVMFGFRRCVVATVFGMYSLSFVLLCNASALWESRDSCQVTVIY